MDKPYLIMRNSMERDEGIGLNGIMFNGDIDAIERFAKLYQEMSKGEPYIERGISIEDNCRLSGKGVFVG